MATTLQNLTDICYNILREGENSSAYPLTLVQLLCNEAQLNICTGLVIDPLTGETANKGQLPFNVGDQFYSSIASTSLTAVTSSGDTTLDVADTTNFPSTGAIYIDGDIATYTGKTSTTFTGVSGVAFAHLAGTQVDYAYALPSDFFSPINVIVNHDYKLQAMLYDDVFESANANKQSLDTNWRRTQASFYTIKDATYLLIFNRDVTGDLIHLRYEKIPTTMSTSSSTTVIDNDIYAQSTIPYLATAKLLYNRNEEARAGELMRFGMNQLKQMYSFYNKKNYESISGVQYRVQKGGINI